MKIRLLGLVLLHAVLTGALEKRPDPRIVIIVNAANPVRTLTRQRLAQIFLREVIAWDDGAEILPVDQIDKSSAHAVFTRQVLGQSVMALKRYWQERIFSGNESPPPDRVTDGDVLTYVRSNPGAIGYVLDGQNLGPGVRPVVMATSATQEAPAQSSK
jgi:hypothetical protein